MNQVSNLGKRIVELEETIAQLKSMNTSLQELRLIITIFSEGIQQGLAVVQDGNIIWANGVGAKMFGYEIEELINTPGFVLAHPDYRKKLAARLNMIQAGDVLSTYDVWPCLTKNRVVKQIRGYASRIVYGGKPAILTILVDASEEMKLQEELTTRAEMLDLVSDSVFLLDLKGNIKYVNKAVCESLGYTQDEITKMSVVDINPEELRRRAGIRLKLASPQKESRFKTVHVRKNGSRMPVDVRIRVIKRGDQQLILGVVREILPEGVQDI
jgi:PAS domain S-box-containing protein